MQRLVAAAAQDVRERGGNAAFDAIRPRFVRS
jgi:hypothetical protein